MRYVGSMADKLDRPATVRLTKRDIARIEAIAARGITTATVLRVALRLGLSELESEKSSDFVNVLAGAAA